MTDVVGNPEEERRAEFYHEPWSQEAVSRYFYCKVRRNYPRCWLRMTLPAREPLNLLTCTASPSLADPAAPAGAGAIPGRAQHIKRDLVGIMTTKPVTFRCFLAHCYTWTCFLATCQSEHQL